MALKNTAPREHPIRAAFNWVTQAGASVLQNVPFGGAVGVVGSGVVLWFAPQFIPDGWSAEAVLSLGMGSGIVLHRLADGLLGWFIEPARRHLGARWEAFLRLGKLDRYRERGLIGTDIADELMGRIVKDDITARQRPGK
jgi:hypothetical protein